MTLKSAEECACRILDNRKDTSRKRPLVILAGTESLQGVRHMVSASLPPGTVCYGSVWRSPSGEVVVVKRYEDIIPPYPHGFDLEVCNGGREYTADERYDLKRWRNAAD